MYPRLAMQGMKVAWTGNRKPHGCNLSPLELHGHFSGAECVYGVGQPKTDIPSLKTTSLIVSYASVVNKFSAVVLT
jgi:hypothetical protein